MESWRRCWRDGFVPNLPTEGLVALRDALEKDDQRLIQGGTCSPPPLTTVSEWPCEAACAVSFAGWQGERLETVVEVQEFFGRTCYAADNAIGESAGCRWFLNWFDETPRDVMRPLLLEEVELALKGRANG